MSAANHLQVNNA